MPGAIHTEDSSEYRFFPVKEYTLNVSLQAGHDGHIALVPAGEQDVSPIVEIFIGGWENNKSAIRLNREKPDKAEAETPSILSEDEARNFIIKWNTSGLINVFHEGSSDPFMSWTMDDPFAVTHFGLRTFWGASGDWKIDGVRDVHTDDSENYAFFPVHCGELDFQVRAGHDAHVALTPGASDDLPIYEVFLGGWENTKCAIRLNKEKPDVAEKEVEKTVADTEYRGFKIKWNISGVVVCHADSCETLMKWDVEEPIPIRYFGVKTSWGADGYWKIEGVEGEVEDPAEAEAAPAEEPPKEEEPAEPAAEDDAPPPEEGEKPAEEKAKREVPTVEGVTWVAASGGDIPEGALAGGNDNGGDLYVARIKFDEAVIPGKLFPEHCCTYGAWGGQEISNEEYEVLVVDADSVSWEAVTEDNIPENAIPGGVTMEGETLYIGRTSHEGAVAIGKVHPSHKCLYISYGGGEHGFSEYEILVKN